MAYFVMQQCTGPACNRCGCHDVTILREPKEPAEGQTYALGGIAAEEWQKGPWWGSGRARCNHCRNEFTFREIPAESAKLSVTKDSTKCPKCGGRYWKYTTKGKAPYRKCKDCGHSKSKG